MLLHPLIDPVAFQIGPVKVHWYGLMYLLAFAVAWWLGRLRARETWRGWSPTEVDDLIFYGMIGVIVGGRLGYTVFYGLPGHGGDPWSLLRVWEGGMSFHGGLLGVLAAMWLFARRRGRRFFSVADFLAPLVPFGLAAGRVGNFINGELWGRPTDLPWGVVFPSGGELARHPSQLYQAALEGLALFALLWWFSRRPRPAMAVSGLFLTGYGVFRGLVEFVREPDAHIGYLAGGWLTMGHVLTVPMLVAGVALLLLAHRRGSGSSSGAPLPEPAAPVAPDTAGSTRAPRSPGTPPRGRRPRAGSRR
jgi:phosphatidylglycerol---prolipoprotein diacylglyceryl transferase